jgi:hypothetical protein
VHERGRSGYRDDLANREEQIGIHCRSGNAVPLPLAAGRRLNLDHVDAGRPRSNALSPFSRNERYEAQGWVSGGEARQQVRQHTGGARASFAEREGVDGDEG